MAFFDLPPPPRRRQRKKTVVVVACSAKKAPLRRGEKVPARILYSASDLFRKAAKYAIRHGDEWVILSAKHGLVSPGQVLGDYNVRIPRSGDRKWAAAVADQLRQRYDPNRTRFVVLASAPYRKHLFEPGSEFTYTAPLEGLGIGQQKTWLKERAE